MPAEANIFQRVFQRGQGSQQSKSQQSANTRQQSSGRIQDSNDSEFQQSSQSQDNAQEIEGADDSKVQRPTQRKANKSPLDDFADLFEPPDPNKQTEDIPPSLSISADKLKAHVDKLDFTRDLPEEVVGQLASMGEQGKLFLSLLNHVGRQAYSTAVQHSSALTDKFVGIRSEYDGKSLPNRVKSELVRSGFQKSNSHPVVKAAQEMLAAQLQARNPDATPEWIQEKTNSFFTELGKQLGPKGSSEDADSDSREDVNWLEFVGMKKPDKAA